MTARRTILVAAALLLVASVAFAHDLFLKLDTYFLQPHARAEQFNAYLEEDGLPDVLEARRAGNELGKAARERYSKHVKAVFQVGEARSQDFGVVLGYPAEIVPLENPYALARGTSFRVRCLVDGQPVRNQTVLWVGRRTVTPSPSAARARMGTAWPR